MGLIALGVSGGIGAYKAVEVARGLQKCGHEVVAVMTKAAQEFVGPLTFEAITRRPVILDQFSQGKNASIEHIQLASSIDALLVAPATANQIGKFAHGIADDFLSTLYLATSVPVVIAPAMNTNMLEHASVKRNLELLRSDGVRVIDSETGDLACGWHGDGRLAEPAVIVETVHSLLQPQGSMLGKCILITAGPTYEDFDPVRFLGNRSSGRMGFALAIEAVKRGARVILVTGPTSLSVPERVEVTKIRSAAEMQVTVMAHVEECDAVIMAAAVADYTPISGRAEEKQVKSDEVVTVKLKLAPDILAELGKWREDRKLPLLVGFSAECREVNQRARIKLEAKKIDLIVANDVSRQDAGFDVGTNIATLITKNDEDLRPLQSKSDLAHDILNRVETILTRLGKPLEARP
jgi:phosphopantothenoylcysteine decarboxylase/phosphopantothenate--cysteine ligase|tara:strand:+ start:1162 stop:2385 length:1224 start_codon:yes stop_codon:yes gene_type:complete